MNENIKYIKSISEHKGWVNSLCLLHDNRFASCSNDGNIKIFNKSTYECEITIPIGKKFTLTSICQLDNNDILSSTNEKSILAFSISGNKYSLAFINKSAHDGWITKAISLPNNRYATSSNDNTISVWSCAPYSEIPLTTLIKHKQYINSMLYVKNKDLLISGSYDYSIIMWNATNYQSVIAIDGVYCCDRNSIKQIDEERIIVGGNNHIYIINISEGKVEQDVKDNFGFVNSFMKLKEDVIICGLFGEVYLYNMKEKKGEKVKSEHTKTLNDFLKIDDNVFISCSEDHNINIYTY